MLSAQKYSVARLPRSTSVSRFSKFRFFKKPRPTSHTLQLMNHEEGFLNSRDAQKLSAQEPSFFRRRLPPRSPVLQFRNHRVGVRNPRRVCSARLPPFRPPLPFFHTSPRARTLQPINRGADPPNPHEDQASWAQGSSFPVPQNSGIPSRASFLETHARQPNDANR